MYNPNLQNYTTTAAACFVLCLRGQGVGPRRVTSVLATFEQPVLRSPHVSHVAESLRYVARGALSCSLSVIVHYLAPVPRWSERVLRPPECVVVPARTRITLTGT